MDKRYEREGPGLEFDRVSFFTDAIYAIAMTLLVVDLKLPESGSIDSTHALIAAIGDLRWQIFGFFLGFLLLGRRWIEHHRFFSQLRSIGPSIISVNLLSLACVAFSPFSVMLISRYEENPVAFLIFALTLAALSALEVVLYVLAVRGHHLAEQPTAARFRAMVIMSSMPGTVMVLSLPLALYSTTAALLSWLAMIPIGRILHRTLWARA